MKEAFILLKVTHREIRRIIKKSKNVFFVKTIKSDEVASFGLLECV
jgi:hypothetical protein